MRSLPGPEYECKKCDKVFSIEEYSRSAFCPSCGSHVWPKVVRRPPSKKGGTEIKPEPLTPDQINMDTLFAEFKRLHDFRCGESVFFANVPLWIAARRRAYSEFREKLGQDRLVDWEKLLEDFRGFLYFKNNLSWTTLYRTGLGALADLDRLWKLLVFLQDESVGVQERVRQGLQGAYYCRGIGKNILTALLHTFSPDRYGVWNNRTEDTLRIIRRPPSPVFDAGMKYKNINDKLIQLTKELDTDLTTVDGFMWFISKKVQVID